MNPSIQTIHGRYLYDLRYPNPKRVDIRDITHALSLICRFNGHTREFYSVAQHSCLVAARFAGRTEKLWALLHDAHEAYVGDVTAPMTSLISKFRLIKNEHQAAIYEALELRHPSIIVEAAIKRVDLRMLFTERRDLFPKEVDWGWTEEPYAETIRPWTAETARRVFLETYMELQR